MMLPVYQSTDTYKQAQSIFSGKEESHSGLWFERFYEYQIFNNDGSPITGNEKKQTKINEKEAFFRTFGGNLGTRECGNEKNLQNYALRQFSLCQAQGGQSAVYQNDWLMAIGLGNSHPLENGLLWHPTLGVPYFQGSTVKGMAKALMEKWGAEPQIIKKWFGSVNAITSPTADFEKIFGKSLTDAFPSQLNTQQSDEQDQATGAFIFLDAIPIKPVMLKQSIMTPHYSNWYQEGDTDPTNKDVQPGDWHSPTPIKFLAVEKAIMQFGVIPRLGAKVNDDELEQINNVIAMALEHLGIGSKTATGYGKMAKDKKADNELKESYEQIQIKVQKELELQNKLSNASEIESNLVEQIAQNNWETSNDAIKHSFTQAIPKWLEILQANPKERNAIEEFYRIAYIHYPKQLANPKKAKENQKEWILPLLELYKS